MRSLYEEEVLNDEIMNDLSFVVGNYVEGEDFGEVRSCLRLLLLNIWIVFGYVE